MSAELQLGTFVLLNAIGLFALLFFNKWSGVTMLITTLVFFVLALYMSADYNVVITNQLQLPNATATTETVDTRDYAMNVTSFTATAQIYATPQIQAEYVSNSSSALYNQEIECIAVQIRKQGSPTGNADVGIFNSTGGSVKSFGTQNVAALTTSQVWHSYCLTNDSYILQADDRVGLKYTGGDASNNVVIVLDGGNPFDGVLSYRQQFATGSWSSQTAQDMTMQLWKGEDVTTIIETTTFANSNQTTLVIDSTQYGLGWLYMGMALIFFVIFIWRAFF